MSGRKLPSKYKSDSSSTKALCQITYQGHQYTAISQLLPAGNKYNGISIERNDLYSFLPKIFEVIDNTTIVHRVEPVKELTPELTLLITDKVKLLHLKGYGHGNLTLENIVIRKGKPYFISFQDMYKLDGCSWQRELAMRSKKYKSLDGLISSDYTLWGGILGNIISPTVVDPYRKRFYLKEYPLDNREYLSSLDFARLFSVNEYYIATVGVDTYIDMTGIYTDYNAMIQCTKSFLVYHSKKSKVLEEVLHQQSKGNKKFRETVVKNLRGTYISPKEHLLDVRELSDLSFLSNPDDSISRLSVRHYDSYLKLSPEDYFLALRLFDVANVLGCNLLTTSFAFIHEKPEQVVRVLLSVAKDDKLEERGKSLVEYAIKNSPSFVAILLSHATNIDSPLTWLYEIMSKYMKQTKLILRQIKGISWNVHYSYIIFLVESLVNIEGDKLSSFLFKTCEESSYYRIIAYYNWDKDIDITVEKIDDYTLQTRDFPKHVGFNYPDEPLERLIGNYPTHHYISQRLEDDKISLEEYTEIISNDLDKIEVLALVNDSWEELKEIVPLYLKNYNENVRKLIILILKWYY